MFDTTKKFLRQNLMGFFQQLLWDYFSTRIQHPELLVTTIFLHVFFPLFADLLR